ncbi:isochorismate synthase MenF [Sporosarcina sp. JAI121]|uniref:isochorismate synthase n=1 Tax=Sporosarcina sp. JAI121 TaxID=2723064 RepID=UPI0015CA091B|nr:isochorismate synthase [Sporosarcina sp. JAI121]NYF25528.1 menaquinone-specific isochorismate synthase [Sporosarcina sp. JAI121]
MNRKLTATRESQLNIRQTELRFFTETVDAGRISPLAFFEAGDSCYKDERFYWQNADKTLTLVGIGHATVLTSEGAEDRFAHISKSWKKLCAALIKEENDREPVLFGGFSFDPQSEKDSEWAAFPSAHFVVPSFQLSIANGKTTIAINLVTESDDAADQFEKLRDERDRLIHIAQVEDFALLAKPEVISIEELEKEHYLETVSKVTKKINNGEAEKVVIARSLKLNFEHDVSAATALHHISNEQQESYHFGLQKDSQLFFGATPERLIEISNGRAYSACVAGSIKRGKSATEDRELGDELLEDSKNREEHQYVVNMISRVFNTFCTDIKISKVPKLMKVRDIQHLFTPVEGIVEQGTDIFSLVEALHPTPALGGVPTDISMDIIRSEENMDRGYYAAPIGWTDTAGNGEFAVAIRSALLDGDSAYLYAGGGIVADSEPDKEYDETWVKFRPVMRALGGKLNG